MKAKILFRIPWTIYFLAWDSELRLLFFVVKRFVDSKATYEYFKIG